LPSGTLQSSRRQPVRAFLFNGYGGERQLRWIKKERTATRNMLSQIVRNFQLRFHSTHDAPNIGKSCKDFQSSLGLAEEDARLAKLAIAPMATAPAPTLRPELLKVLKEDVDCDKAAFGSHLESQGVCRVMRLRW
jgi:hypothetical protein